MPAVPCEETGHDTLGELPPPRPPEEAAPKPAVHWGGVSGERRGAVDALLGEYQGVWAVQLGKIVVTRHRIEIDACAQSSSTLDCNAGYRKIPVAAEDCDKKTFVCHKGAYRYGRLLFGLSNAPETFRRAIDMMQGEIKWNICLIYLEGIIVFSQTSDDHVEHLREVFAALRNAVVSLKVKKWYFFR